MIPVTIGAILFSLTILILVALFLVRPFFRPPLPEVTSDRQQLLDQKEGLLVAIHALDFDHDTGKLPDEEYEQQRSALMSQAAVTLKALDELPAQPVDSDVYAQIEAALSKVKQQHAAAANGAAHFCTNCGRPLDAGDKFCAHCGQPAYAAQPLT